MAPIHTIDADFFIHTLVLFLQASYDAHMPISPAVLARIFQTVARLSQAAFQGNRLIRRVDSLNIDDYLVSIVRRGSLGADGAVSQMVKMFKNGKLFEV